MDCYICGYEIEGDDGIVWEDQTVHSECYRDSDYHYHLWIVADNGRNVARDAATAIYRRAPRFSTREQAMRAARTRYGRDRADAMALRCRCDRGER